MVGIAPSRTTAPQTSRKSLCLGDSLQVIQLELSGMDRQRDGQHVSGGGRKRGRQLGDRNVEVWRVSGPLRLPSSADHPRGSSDVVPRVQEFRESFPVVSGLMCFLWV